MMADAAAEAGVVEVAVAAAVVVHVRIARKVMTDRDAHRNKRNRETDRRTSV